MNDDRLYHPRKTGLAEFLRMGVGGRLAGRPLLAAMAVIFCLGQTLFDTGWLTAHAQTATASLDITVVDESGAVIPDALVKVINIGNNQNWKAKTNGSGLLGLPFLPPGTYKVEVEREGFSLAEVRDVILQVGDQIVFRIKLQVGIVDSTVTVTGEAGRVQTSATVGTIISRQFIENLPLNGRSFQSLIGLTPGVVLTKADVASRQGQFSVNGQRQNSNYFTVDGVSANVSATTSLAAGEAAAGTSPALGATGGSNNLVSVDALQEFKIQTSTFAPEFGRTPGAQVSIVTRSGTNQFHGTVFNYFRNDALDSNDWFANREGFRKLPLRQNDFGGVFNGPLFKDHTFFFFSYEGLRLRLPQVGNIVVPSADLRQSAPAGIQPFLRAYPVPNREDLGNGFSRFSGTYSNPSNLDAASLRVDHTFNEALTIFGRYNYAPSESVTRSSNLSTLSKTDLDTQTLTFGATHRLRPGLMNDLRANYSRFRALNSLSPDNFGGATVPPDSALFPPFASPETAANVFGVTGLPSLLVGNFGNNLQRQFNLVDNMSVVSGVHQVKLGVDYRRLSPVYKPRNSDQNVSFGGVAGLRSGIANSVLVNGRETLNLKFHNLSAYAQDTWQVTPKLTLTYGLRWELNVPPSGEAGRELFTVEGLENLSALRLAPRGTPLWASAYDNFAPRMGMAYQWSQRPGLERVVRGGVGIFYDIATAASTITSSAPYVTTRRLPNAVFPLTPEQARPLPISLDPPYGTMTVADPHLELPRVYHFNLALEQSLGNNQTVSATYIGAIGRRLLRREQFISPNQDFASTLRVTRNASTSDYHGLQLQFRRRISRGLQALASYTWAHSIDTDSADLTTFDIPASKLDPQLDRGPSGFDVRHVLTGAFSYNIPSALKHGFGARLLGDWSIDSLFRAQTATPVNIVSSRDIGFGSFDFRPDLVPGIPLYVDDPDLPGGRRFNRNAFVVPSENRQGNLGRNSLRGFPLSQVDFSLRRQFQITEQWNLQFRAEFFNLFNQANFADPVNNLTDPIFFGISTQMLGRSMGNGGPGGLSPLYQIGGPRSIQLALKLNF
jgi:carboxypeptidase family protein/TonB-dependent receptor-like protein